MYDGLGAVQVQTAAQPQVQSGSQDPMQARWYFNGVVRDKFIEGSKAGFGELKFARWGKIEHFSTPEEIHSTDDDPNFPREAMKTKTAKSVETYLASVLGAKTVYGDDDPHKVDFGIRFGFYGEEDLAKMEVVSATLLPSLPEIRQIAKNYNMLSPIGDRCEGQDSVEFGERQSCPTCWATWLDSDCCSRFMSEIAQTGRNVEVVDIITKAVERKTVHVAMSELEVSRQIMKESFQRGLIANQNIWMTIAEELNSKERRGIDAYQNNIRKDVHAAKPQDANLKNIQEFAKASAVANQGGPVANDPTAGMTTQEKAQYYTDLAEFEQFRANKKEKGAETEYFFSHGRPQEAEPLIAFIEGAPVLCDGLPGVISEVKDAGWYAVALDNGETKNVRKDKLQRRVE